MKMTDSYWGAFTLLKPIFSPAVFEYAAVATREKTAENRKKKGQSFMNYKDDNIWCRSSKVAR